MHFTSLVTQENFYSSDLQATGVEVLVIDQGLTPRYMELFRNSIMYVGRQHDWIHSFQGISQTFVFLTMNNFTEFNSFEVLTNQNTT